MNHVDKIISTKWLLNEKNNSLLEDYSVIIDGNIIKDIIPSSQVRKSYTTDDRILLQNHIVLPGLINSYNDSSLLWMQNDSSIKGKIQENSYAKFKNIYLEKNHRDVSSKISIIEMIKGGITTLCDSGIFPESMIDEAKKSNIRCLIGLGIQTKKTTWAENENEYLDKSLRIFDNYNSDPDINFFFNPASIENISEKTLRKISKISNELDVPVKMSVSNIESEIKYSLKNYNCRPIQYLEKVEILNNKFTLLNTINLNEDDIKILKKYRVNLNIDKYTKVLSKNINIKNILDNKINITLSSGSETDSSLSNMLEEVSMLSLLSNALKDEIDTEDLLNFITINSARAIGLENHIGLLSKGYLADIISININELLKRGPLSINGIERKLKSSDIDNIWISGKYIMKNKKLMTISEEKIYDRFRSIKSQVLK
jgi:5-methylthioadenosine/S-adenosylhomocysteine deaminase